MKLNYLIAGLFALGLVACSDDGVHDLSSPEAQRVDAYFASPAEDTEPARLLDEQQASNVQIAYAYSAGFRVEHEDLETLQQRHVAACEALGEECRILQLSRSGDADNAYGEIHLEVVATKAGDFGDGLADAAEGLDAEQVSYAVSGEDLTKQIIDTEARLESRRVLRDRLMEVLRGQTGSVSEIVAAERGVAEVNEEIDAAASLLATLRGRVAFSKYTLQYSRDLAVSRTGFWAPVREAFASVTSTLGVTIAAIIYALVALIPVLMVLLGLRWLWRRSGLRLRRQKSNTDGA